MSTTSERLQKQMSDIARDVHEMGSAASTAAQDKVEHVLENVSAYREQGREKVQNVAANVEHFVRGRPFATMLIAAGVGWFFGRFWKRR